MFRFLGSGLWYSPEATSWRVNYRTIMKTTSITVSVFGWILDLASQGSPGRASLQEQSALPATHILISVQTLKRLCKNTTKCSEHIMESMRNTENENNESL